MSNVMVAPVVPHEIDARAMRRTPISIALAVYEKGSGQTVEAPRRAHVQPHSG
jgi:hypothetical protein